MPQKPSLTTRKRPDDFSLASRTKRFASMFLTGAAAMGILFFALSSMAFGAMHDDLVIDPKAVALANAVTASPPGIMSVHYNPAGLSTLPEGHSFNLGVSYQSLEIERSFTSNPDSISFLDIYESIPIFRKEGGDPLDGKTSKNSNSQMVVPFTSDTTVDFILSPSLGIANREKGSKWTFGVGSGYMPYAWGFTHDDPDDPSRFGAKSMYAQHTVMAAPAVSYRFTPNFSMGLSVGLGQSSLGAEQEFRASNTVSQLSYIVGDLTGYIPSTTEIAAMIPPAVMELMGPFMPILMQLQTFMDMIIPPFPWFGGGLYPYYSQATLEYDMHDNFSPNYNVGMLWDTFSWLSLGLCYRSEIKQEFTGDYRFTYGQDFQNLVDWYGSNMSMQFISSILSLPTESVESQSGTVTLNTKLPQSAQGGIKVKPFSWLRLTSDLKWTNWSAINEDRLVFDQNIQLIRIMNFAGMFDPNSDPENIFSGTSNVLVIERHFKDTYDWSVGAEIDPFRWLTLRFGYEARQSCVEDEYFDLMYAVPDTDNYGAGFEIHFADGLHLSVGLSYTVGKEYEINYTESKNLSGTESVTPYNGLDIKQDTTEAYTVSVAFHGTTAALGEWWNRLYKPY